MTSRWTAHVAAAFAVGVNLWNLLTREMPVWAVVMTMFVILVMIYASVALEFNRRQLDRMEEYFQARLDQIDRMKD